METAGEKLDQRQNAPVSPSPGPAPADSMEISPRKNPLKRIHNDIDGENQGDDDEPSNKRARQDSTTATLEAKPALVRANSSGNPDRSKSIQLREWRSDDGQIIQVRIGDITLEDTGTSSSFLIIGFFLISIIEIRL